MTWEVMESRMTPDIPLKEEAIQAGPGKRGTLLRGSRDVR